MINKNINYNFLANISHLVLHWCSDCNMLCKYCYIEKHHKIVTDYNKKIREALKDGSFVQNIFDIYDMYPQFKEQVDSYSFWGAEPTINGDLFAQTHKALMDYFPNLKMLMFSTNALVGGDNIVNNFIKPMLEYDNSRKFTFDLQFSLDGPPWFNDISRGANATARTLQAIKTVMDSIPNEGNVILKLSFKPTFDLKTIHDFVDNPEKLQDWYNWFDNTSFDLIEYAHNNPNINVQNLCGSPTFVVPMLASTEDGIYYKKFVQLLMKIDTTNLKIYQDCPLYISGYNYIEEILQGKQIDYDWQFGTTTCSAGKNNFTFDYDGSINTCFHIMPVKMDIENGKKFMLDEHILTSNKLSPLRSIKNIWGEYSYHANYQTRYHMFSLLTIALANNNQILSKYAENEDERKMLWFAMVPFTCHLTNEDLTGNPAVIPLGQLRLWGNGVIDELIKYYHWENERFKKNYMRAKGDINV